MDPKFSGHEQPVSPDSLNDPEVQAAIEAARERAKQGNAGRGKTSEELMRLARDQRHVGTRTQR